MMMMLVVKEEERPLLREEFFFLKLVDETNSSSELYVMLPKVRPNKSSSMIKQSIDRLSNSNSSDDENNGKI